MATEYQQAEDTEEAGPRQVSYDSILGANCMLWGMIIGLSLIVLVILIWAVSHIGSI